MTAVIKKVKFNNTSHDIHDARISNIDTSVIQGSENPVTSGAVYDEIDDIPVVKGTGISSAKQVDSYVEDFAGTILPLYLTGAAGATTYGATGAAGLTPITGYYSVGDAISYGEVFTKIVSLTGNSVTLQETLSSDTALNNVQVKSYFRYSNTASGTSSSALGSDTTASGFAAHSEGTSTTASGISSHAEGNRTTTSGNCSHAEGYGSRTLSSYTISGEAEATTYTTSTTHNIIVGQIVEYNDIYRKVTAVPSTTSFTVDNTFSSDALSDAKIYAVYGVAYGDYSHSEGFYTNAIGDNSHTEGDQSLASGDSSHAEGDSTTASGYASHAEGDSTTASGGSSHAEGSSTTASGNYSHTEGSNTTAEGNYSHSEGRGTIAQNQSEHAQGQYNVSNKVNTTFGNSGNTIHSIGIGTNSSHKANAVEVMQNADVYINGLGSYDGTTITGASTLQTVVSSKEDVSNKVTSITSSSTDTEYPSAKAVYDAIEALPEPMVFQGTIGTSGTSSTVPSSPKEGDTYKIIEGGTSLTFPGITGTIKVGDTVIYKNTTVGWVLIPSGDEPSGTVTSITAGTGLNTTSNNTATDGGTISSSGTLYLTKSGVSAGTYQGIQVDKYGRVISASDQGYGTYTKPSGGIPSSDLADVYAAGISAGGAATKTVAIPFGKVDSTSTSTAITATVDNFPSTLSDGVCAYIQNGVVSSASGYTLNINGTGALPVYQTLQPASRTSTIFSINYTMLFVYNSTRVEGGCWDIFYGYNTNDNTVGYLLRTNYYTQPVSGAVGRYRILFTSADGTKFVPANTSTSTSATTSKTVNQEKIDPFGKIVYYYSTTDLTDGDVPNVTVLWEQYTVNLGYSFNTTGASLGLTLNKPVYIKCAPQTDGSAIIDSTTPYVQDLPITGDGKIYIFLGIAYGTSSIELTYYHPVYYHDGTAIRIWIGANVQDKLVSGTNIKTVNNNSLLGSGNVSVGDELTSNKVTSWSSTTTDTHYPSEKLVKDSLDGKQNTIDSSHKLDYSLISNTPTTLGGYGITDAIDTTATDQTKTGSITAASFKATNKNIYVGSTSGDQCHLQYDSTNKCLKFIFD